MNYIYLRTKYFNYHIADRTNKLLNLYEDDFMALFNGFDGHFPRMISLNETEV